jgi:hypothetical protein
VICCWKRFILNVRRSGYSLGAKELRPGFQLGSVASTKLRLSGISATMGKTVIAEGHNTEYTWFSKRFKLRVMEWSNFAKIQPLI